MVLPGNLSVQYLCGPKIHTDLAGKPLAIIGNVSNKIGEFSLAIIPLSSVKIFFSAIKKGCNADLIEHGDNIPDEFCKETKWHQSLATHVGMVLPNIFLVYFGQNIPLGPIMSEKIKLAFDCLGSGYEAWSIMV